MRITIKDLARIAGVSHSTVSRSLNNSPLISENTKERIKKLAKEHHFEFNANARSLSTKRTDSVGVILPPLHEHQRHWQYLGALMNSIRFSLEKTSVDCITTFPENSWTGESNIRKLVNRHKVDGLLLVIPDIEQTDLDFLQEKKVPAVILHFKQQGIDAKQFNYIYTDHKKGGYLATSHLMKAGRQSIMTMTEDGEILEYSERTEGFRSALSDGMIPVHKKDIFIGECSIQFGYDTIMDNKNSLSGHDGIFAQSDFTAIGAIQALKELGVKVPDDIAVVGYDDIEIGTFFKPTLTTIHQPKEKYSVLACERLIELINGTNVESCIHVVIEPKLIVRESCGMA